MKYLLTNGNRELAKDGVFTWSLPALSARLSSGQRVTTCPNAGACARLCYARSGTYNFSNVKAAHVRNLEMTLDDLDGWREQMLAELQGKRYRPGKWVRIHDSGDFYSEPYFLAWKSIAEATPDVNFYAYTKEVVMVKRHELPKNFTVIFSMGGKQDRRIDKDRDRHAEVFPTMEDLVEAGYTDQEDSDILAATLPTTRIGIVVNNIKHLVKRQGRSTFGELQQDRYERAAALGAKFVEIRVKGNE